MQRSRAPVSSSWNLVQKLLCFSLDLLTTHQDSLGIEDRTGRYFRFLAVPEFQTQMQAATLRDEVQAESDRTRCTVVVLHDLRIRNSDLCSPKPTPACFLAALTEG
ncbi:hypothetical protein A4X13_0g7629 [Tilletia indica]|uniref:Uncharacterized protein n=1 Tax=Tilletia indica TaxID=43049 RepID=A0A177T767_9BASI|nr:hypothetical protein A4X13_0g7629 [Tilletia indica]